MSMTYEEQLAKAEKKLAMWEEAEERVAISGQKYTLVEGDTRRELTRANLQLIRQSIDFYTRKINRLEKLIANGTTGRIMFGRGV